MGIDIFDPTLRVREMDQELFNINPNPSGQRIVTSLLSLPIAVWCRLNNHLLCDKKYLVIPIF
jgi:hypothetical protein